MRYNIVFLSSVSDDERTRHVAAVEEAVGPQIAVNEMGAFRKITGGLALYVDLPEPVDGNLLARLRGLPCVKSVQPAGHNKLAG